MEYNLVSAVWEITMGCNMRCKHCGSSCENPQAGEMTTDEALKLCDDLGKLNMKFVTLSGGEPTTRRDWHLIAKRLRENNIIPTMITNGWLMNEEIAGKAVESGINTIALSIDGLQETHDYMRREGSFERSINALELMRKKGIPSSVITTINKENINQLDSMKEIFIDKGVHLWQLQFGLPMGNLADNSELVISPQQVDDIIEFGYKNIDDKRIKIYFADCVGYYNSKEVEVRNAYKGYENTWTGCSAGKGSIGILHNGDILGCTSIRNEEFIEGNIRETPIHEIWTRPGGFKWNREMNKSKLKGFCGKCKYGDVCLGGCTNSRLCMEKDIYQSNSYCSYYIAMAKAKEKISGMSDINNFYSMALELVEKNNYQLAGLVLERLLEKNAGIDALNLYGYVNYKLKNYETSKEINEAVLKIDPENVYANKGLGLCLGKLGKLEEGLLHLRKSMKLTDSSFMDPFYDTALLLLEHGRKQEAVLALLEARKISEEFFQRNKELYTRLELA